MARVHDGAPEHGGVPFAENVGARGAPVVACDAGYMKAVKASSSEADSIFDIAAVATPARAHRTQAVVELPAEPVVHLQQDALGTFIWEMQARLQSLQHSVSDLGMYERQLPDVPPTLAEPDLPLTFQPPPHGDALNYEKASSGSSDLPASTDSSPVEKPEQLVDEYTLTRYDMRDRLSSAHRDIDDLNNLLKDCYLRLLVENRPVPVAHCASNA